MFGQDWDRAEATIVARDAKFSGDGSVATYTYVADVRLSSDSAQGQAALAAFSHLGAPVVQTTEVRLMHLRAMQERGLLTPEEYADQRHRILDEV